MSLRVLVRNALSLTGANAVSNALGFAVTVLLVRYLGVEGIGRYTYLTTYAALFGILSSFGLYLVLTRQIAAAPREAGARLGVVLRLQAWLAPLAVTVTVGSALPFHAPWEALAIGIAAVGVVLGSVAGTYGAVLTGTEKIHVNAAVNVGMAVLWLCLVLGLMAARQGVFVLILLFVIHKAATLATLRLACRKACDVVPRSEPGSEGGRRLLATALPFALLLVLNDVYWNAGIVLLGRLKGAVEVGTFAVAYRVLAVVVAAVGTVSGVLYPRFSHLFATDRDRFLVALAQTRKYALASGLPLGAAIVALSDRLVAALFGPRFEAASVSLAVLGGFVPFACLYSPLSMAMVAMGAERQWLTILAAATGVVIAGNLLLIPFLGHLGAAGALLVSGVFLAAAVFLACRSRGLPVFVPADDLRIGAGFATMGLILWWLREWPFPAFFAAAAAYGTILHASGFVSAEEREALRVSLAGKD